MKHIRAHLSPKFHSRRPTRALRLRPELFHPIQGSCLLKHFGMRSGNCLSKLVTLAWFCSSGFLRRSEIEDHDAMKMGVAAPAAAAAKAGRSASRLAAASRTSRTHWGSIDRDGPRRFASCSAENRKPSPHLIVPRKETSTGRSTPRRRARNAWHEIRRKRSALVLFHLHR